MTELKQVLSTIADTTITTTNDIKIEQKQARNFKAQIMNALLNDFKATLESDNLVVERTADGIAVAIDNEVGFVSVVFNATLKNLDYEVEYESENYKTEQESKLAEKQAKAKAKAEHLAKIKAKSSSKTKSPSTK